MQFNDSGIPILIENCHDEQQPSKPIAEGGCADYHTFRASTDIRNTYGSWVLNAYSVQQYTDGRTGPTCWAFADMLMVGVGETCAGDTCAEPPLPSATEQRTHFGLWCVISSPLTLSMDFANATLVDAAWPIVTNVAAIAVNQAWAGAPGGQLFADYSANVTLQHCTPGWAHCRARRPGGSRCLAAPPPSSSPTTTTRPRTTCASNFPRCPRRCPARRPVR
jgi:hypothetical protein